MATDCCGVKLSLLLAILKALSYNLLRGDKMFGKKLYEARTKSNLTQEQLAEKLYVTRQAVSRWENDKTQPDFDTLGRICTILGVNSDYFICVEREAVNFKTLPRSRKCELYYSYVKEYKKDLVIYCSSYILCSWCLLGLCFVGTLGIIDNIYGTFGVSPLIWISISIGILLLEGVFIMIMLYVNVRFSAKFNAWLAQKGFARTKKLILPL